MIVGQSKLRSFLEANTNTLVGFLITLLVSPLAYNLVGMKWTFNQLWQITAIFTIISVLRGYIIRRFFNKKEESKERDLLNRIEGLRQINDDFAKNAKYYKDRFSKLWKNYFPLYFEKQQLLDYLEDDIYHPTIRPNELIDLVERKIKSYKDDINSLKGELDMCKHLHTAAISDLVEGADYQIEDTVKPGEENG